MTTWQLIDIKTGRATIYSGLSFAQREKTLTVDACTEIQKYWQVFAKESKFIVLMPDVFTKAKRSQVMSLIHSRGNRGTELAMAKLFRAHKITGWRRNQKVFGKPDFLFRRNLLALFVDGCFWHGCPSCYRQPKSNSKFWKEKIVRNRNRDLLVNKELRKKGWHVVRIWEHDLAKRSGKIIHKIKAALSRHG